MNRTVNVASPIVDARLEDGSRVNVVLPPIALDGAAVTIRKFPEPITMEKLLGFGAVTEEAADFLRQVVESGYNLFISGGTNSGKTTFLNALSAYIPKRERVIDPHEAFRRDGRCGESCRVPGFRRCPLYHGPGHQRRRRNGDVT